MDWTQEVAERYPLTPEQKLEKKLLGSDDMPFIVVNGEKRHYDNAKELKDILNELEDEKYLEWFKEKGGEING